MGLIDLKTVITNHSVAIRADVPVVPVIACNSLFSLNIGTGASDNETVDNSTCGVGAIFNKL